MTALQQLDEYLGSLKRRLRLLTALRGLGLTAAISLALTVGLVWFANRNKFISPVVSSSRVLLFVGVAVALFFVLLTPLRRLTRGRVVQLAEGKTPQFGERLLTLTERADDANPFRELIAEEALLVTREHVSAAPPAEKTLYLFGTAAAGVLAVLVWLIFAGPGFWGFGASLLWTGSPRAGVRPLYEVSVQPGNRTIRRHANQIISAQLHGFSTRNVSLHARYRGASKWDVLPMQPGQGGDDYTVLFAGLSDPLDYYVQADEAKSSPFTLGVKDLPTVQRISVSIRFPSGLGLQNVANNPGGDIRAVAGSEAQVAIKTDRPLTRGVLSFNSGKQVPLIANDAGILTARLNVDHDDTYHVTTSDGGETIRLTDDFYVEAKKDEAPAVRIVNPGRDPHVSPIEEVSITAEATDDFGVDSLDLHYSVNGAPEQVRPLKKGGHAKEVSGKTTLTLEDFKLAPGDLISLYATARDGKNTAKSDMVFAQADPFDYKFQQSQESGGQGGGGGGGGQDAQISARQKEVIAATWNQLKGQPLDRSLIGENARFLSDMENKLGDQAKTLAERMGNRDLSGLNPQFQQFTQSMNAASEAMGTAAGELRPGKWSDAIPAEQKALQSLLRAEAIFRDIQVSYGKQSGGGGGSNGADRDLARMLDLELDTSKNQYESSHSASLSGNDKQAEIDKALQRLKDLARRQQELAEQQKSVQASQQRWEEEQLRREAEELKRQLQELAKGGQSPSSSEGSEGQQQGEAQGQNGQSSSARGSRQSAASRQSGESGANRRGTSTEASNMQRSRMQQSLESLERAEDEMRKAVSNGDKTAQGRAASQLADAERSLNDMLKGAAGRGVSDLRRDAQELANNQKDLAGRVKQLYGAGGINTARPNGSAQDGSDGKIEMPEMSNPAFAGGGWWRRRFAPERDRNATATEKALASESEKLAARMEQLQQQLQRETQRLGGQDARAASKMREALSEAEQNELALRMQKSGEWLRRGYGAQTWPQQDSISAGLDHLSRQLEQSEAAMAPGNSQSAEDRQQQKMTEALSQVQSLRQQLQANAERRPSTQNGQRGRGQSGSQQAGSQQSGSAQSGSPQAGSQRSGGSQPEGSQSGGSPAGSHADDSASSEQQTGSSARNGSEGHPRIGGGGGAETDNALSELQNLKSALGRNDRQLERYLNDAIGSLRQDRGQAGLLDARINDDAITSLERLEMELTRRVGEADSGARTSGNESVPEGYRDAVAEYFKRLSK